MSQEQTTQKTCREDGCEKPSAAKGMCRSHYSKRWYQQNRDSRRETNRRYFERNREVVLERTKEANRRRRSTPEGKAAERARNRERYYADPEKARKKARDWYRKNREKAGPQAQIRMRKAKATRHGLTLEETETILARGCGICGAAPDSGTRSLHLDHDHTTGKVRDALCHGCNTGLGAMRDDPARLRAAANYIEQHREEVVPK